VELFGGISFQRRPDWPGLRVPSVRLGRGLESWGCYGARMKGGATFAFNFLVWSLNQAHLHGVKPSIAPHNHSHIFDLFSDLFCSGTHGTMVRKLKYHEQKLLRKHDFVNYKQDNQHRDHDVARRYMIQKPEDYVSV